MLITTLIVVSSGLIGAGVKYWDAIKAIFGGGPGAA